MKEYISIPGFGSFKACTGLWQFCTDAGGDFRCFDLIDVPLISGLCHDHDQYSQCVAQGMDPTSLTLTYMTLTCDLDSYCFDSSELCNDNDQYSQCVAQGKNITSSHFSDLWTLTLAEPLAIFFIDIDRKKKHAYLVTLTNAVHLHLFCWSKSVGPNKNVLPTVQNCLYWTEFCSFVGKKTNSFGLLGVKNCWTLHFWPTKEE